MEGKSCMFGAVLFILVSQAWGHGYLADPPARNSMWRDMFPNPVNYNDMGLNCGGFANQWDRYNGKCGLCGDPYQGPRKHEAGYPGGYANGIIGRHYKMGSVIEVKARLTANHLGSIAFKLCPVNDKNTKVTEECFNRYPLTDIYGERDISVYNQLRNNPGIMTASLRLPANLVCDQCVIQWYYTAGNNAGPPGTRQESFVNCADVKISRSGGPNPTPAPPAIVKRPAHKTDRNGNSITHTLWDCNVLSPFDAGNKAQANYDWCMNNCITAPPQQRRCPDDMCRCFVVEGTTIWPVSTSTYGPTTSEDKRNPDEWTCKLVPPYSSGTSKEVRTMRRWCVENCVIPPSRERNCPDHICNCYKDPSKTTTPRPSTIAPPPGPQDPDDWRCEVPSPYNRGNQVNGIRRWCIANCVTAPQHQRFCPQSHCNCYYVGPSGTERITTQRPQYSSRGRSSNLYRGRVPLLTGEGICTLVRSSDESSRLSNVKRQRCVAECLSGRRSRRSRCPTNVCRCERF